MRRKRRSTGGEREREREKERKGRRRGRAFRKERKPRCPVAPFLDLGPPLKPFFPPTPPPPPKKKQALLQLEYPDKLQRLLLTPQREVLVELVITRDNGEIEVKGGGI